ncbi:BtpA/SgcQ family protein [Halostella pelagica]|uniref:BtpA/SgcQ family protein n=1 Tax=Halostella pelagica TaxID=2583824 RepID=UPI00107FED10|nr:BtpA/SgcQ family protein [Halostella pelagica]
MTFDSIDAEKPIVGMLHLPPLPGAPRSNGDLDMVREAALRDARRLAAGGVDALMMENFGDAPFYPDDVPKHAVASMTRVAGEVRDAVDLPLGINVLRNDVEAALSVAAAVGADFVRANVHVGARVTDQGVVEGQAHETVRLRERLDCEASVLADLDVKHSAPLATRDTAHDADGDQRAPEAAASRFDAETVAEPVERGLADGVIVSGAGTGHAVATEAVAAAAAARDEAGLDAPVIVGSGVTTENAASLLSVADGAIVGTALKEGGVTTNPVDEERVRRLVDTVDETR